MVAYTRHDASATAINLVNYSVLQTRFIDDKYSARGLEHTRKAITSIDDRAYPPNKLHIEFESFLFVRRRRQQLRRALDVALSKPAQRLPEMVQNLLLNLFAEREHAADLHKMTSLELDKLLFEKVGPIPTTPMG